MKAEVSIIEPNVSVDSGLPSVPSGLRRWARAMLGVLLLAVSVCITVTLVVWRRMLSESCSWTAASDTCLLDAAVADRVAQLHPLASSVQSVLADLDDTGDMVAFDQRMAEISDLFDTREFGEDTAASALIVIRPDGSTVGTLGGPFSMPPAELVASRILNSGHQGPVAVAWTGARGRVRLGLALPLRHNGEYQGQLLADATSVFGVFKNCGERGMSAGSLLLGGSPAPLLLRGERQLEHEDVQKVLRREPGSLVALRGGVVAAALPLQSQSPDFVLMTVFPMSILRWGLLVGWVVPVPLVILFPLALALILFPGGAAKRGASMGVLETSVARSAPGADEECALESLRKAAERLGDSVVVCGQDGMVEYIDEGFQELTGYELADVHGYPLAMLDAERNVEAFEWDIWRPLWEGRTWQGVFACTCKDGEQMRMDATIVPVKDHAGAAKYLMVGHDATDIAVLESRLNQAQKMETIGELVGGVVHDFNNLLTVILGNCSLVKMQPESLDPVLSENIDEISNASKRAASLAKRLLVFSRTKESAPELFDLAEIVGETEKMLQRLIREDVRIQVLLPPEPVFIMADVVQIEQILINLVVNARDAMPTGGFLTVRVSKVMFRETEEEDENAPRPGTYAMLSVKDTGHGMPEDVKERIFEAFFTTKGEEVGTGLGLATVQGIVKKNGGSITVDSQVGVGTTFSIYWPFEAPPRRFVGETSEEGAEAQLPPEMGGRSPCILAVDDEKPLLDMVRRVLTMHGYTVHGATNADQVRRIWKEHGDEVDLLLTDVVMPVMSGVEIAAMLRKERPGLRVVTMSAYTDSVVLKLGVRKNEVQFMQKPFTPDQLLATVRTALLRPDDRAEASTHA